MSLCGLHSKGSPYGNKRRSSSMTSLFHRRAFHDTFLISPLCYPLPFDRFQFICSCTFSSHIKLTVLGDVCTSRYTLKLSMRFNDEHIYIATPSKKIRILDSFQSPSIIAENNLLFFSLSLKINGKIFILAIRNSLFKACEIKVLPYINPTFSVFFSKNINRIENISRWFSEKRIKFQCGCAKHWFPYLSKEWRREISISK